MSTPAVESGGRQTFSASGGAEALRMLEGSELPRPCIILSDQLGPTVVVVLRKPFELDEILATLDRVDEQMRA